MDADSQVPKEVFMKRLTLIPLCFLLALPFPLAGQDAKAEAMSAAPAEVAANATILDAEGNVIQEGTNGYICMPTPQGMVPPQPMCLDEVWMAWADAWQAGKELTIDKPGIAYMLGGDGGVSNTDPAGLDPEKVDDWVKAEQHLMLLFPDKAGYDAFPTDPSYGGPWVMWKGTPYVHLMIPISDVEYALEGGGR
jgi:hypothetical protein